MKISYVLLALNYFKDKCGDIDIHVLIHDYQNNKNLLATDIHGIYYDEKTDAIELFAFLSKDDL